MIEANEVKDIIVEGSDGTAIQTAVDRANAAGGGRVIVKAGVYNCASIRLYSNIDLHLESGTVILGSTNYLDYFDFPQNVCAVRPEDSGRVFIYAYDAENVAITGHGMIDGQGPSFFDQTKYSGSFWSKPPIPRPRMVQFVNCRGVKLEGVTFKDSPGWTMLIRLCENVFVSGITVTGNQRMINNDGIDFDGCRHVKCVHSKFKTGDDCLIVRAMREWNEQNVICEDVEFAYLDLDSTCQTIRLGCPSDDTIRNVHAHHIKANGNNGIFGDYPPRYVRPADEGFMDIHDILIEDYEGEFKGSAAQIIVGDGVRIRSVRDIMFRNLNVKSAHPFNFITNKSSEMKDVTLENVICNGEKLPDGPVAITVNEDKPLVRQSVSWETKVQRRDPNALS